MTAHVPSLIYQVTQSSEVSPAERYEYWLTPLLSDFEAATPTLAQRQDFQGRVASLVAATSELHDMQADPFEGFRSTRRIRAYEDDKLALVYVMQGEVHSRYEGDAGAVTRAGEFLLFDAHRASRMHFKTRHFVQINLPRAALHPLVCAQPAPGAISRAVSGSGLAGLLSGQLAQFRSLGAGLNDHERLGLLHATEALATVVVENACLGGSLDDERRHLGLYTAAQRYIRLHFGVETLDGTKVAAALGCSRATLYRVFARHGLTVAGYIRELRLQKLAQLLQHAPAHPIAQLAHHCGLHDSPNLSRLFRRRFGHAPREFRALHADTRL